MKREFQFECRNWRHIKDEPRKFYFFRTRKWEAEAKKDEPHDTPYFLIDAKCPECGGTCFFEISLENFFYMMMEEQERE